MNKSFPIILLFITILFSSLESEAQICNYNYRKRITFDPTRVGATGSTTDLTNFQALISITSDNDLRVTSSGGYVTNTNGFDIIFTADDGVTILDHQLEKYTSTTGELVVWVKIPTLYTSINTYIYMYYGNSSIATNQSTNNTWNNDYHAVYHLHNNSFADNTGNGYTLTNNGSTNLAASKIAGGRTMDGTNWLEVSNTFPNLTTDFTISGWIYTTNNAKQGQRVFCDDASNTGGYALSLGDGGTGMMRFYSRNSNPVILDGPANQIANNTWYYVTAVADISNRIKTIYVNGVVAASSGFTNAWGTDNANSSVGGETAAGETANRLQGREDEVRIARVARSADWILTEFNNQNSPSTFYTISAHPRVWLGGSNSNWNAAANWQGNNVPAAGEDAIISTTGNQPTLNVNQQLASLWVRGGSTLSLSNRTLSVRFDITNCGTITGNTGTINCNSTNTYIQNQYFSGTGTFNLNDLTVNNTFTTLPTLTLNKDVNVSGALTLTSGIVYTTTTNILALGNSATSSSGSANSFVSGPMSKSGSTDFIFPVGKGTWWRRASLTNISSSSTYRVEYFDYPFTNLTPVNAPLFNVSQIEYWMIDRIAGTGNANIALYWENAALSGISNCPDLTIARWNGAAWDERLGTATGTCAGAGTGNVLTNGLVTTFSPFTFASKTAGINNLPIELLSFDAVANQTVVDIKWKTASELNNDFFTVEKTTDFLNFETVAIVDGAGNSNTILNYFTTDFRPYSGTSYYRLKQTDFNGQFTYSNYVAVNFDKSNEFNIELYPNPAQSENQLSIQINTAKDEDIQIMIYDVQGKKLSEQTIYHETSGADIYPITLLHKLSAGIYFVSAISESGSDIKKLIIK